MEAPNPHPNNPGKHDHLGRDATSVLQVELFDGAKFDFNKVVSPIFLVGHHFSLGSSQMKDNYGFSANFVPNGNNMVGGRIDPMGNLSARMTRQITNNLSTTVDAQLSPAQPTSLSLDTEYFGPSFTVGGKCTNDGYVSGSYVQRFTNSLVGAVEAFRHPRMTGAHISAKYDAKSFVAHGMFATYGLISLSYSRRCSPRVNLATSLQYNLGTGDTFLEAGYNFNLKHATIRARVDTTGTVGCLVEEKIAPGFSVLFSGALDHSKQESRFGVGVTMG